MYYKKVVKDIISEIIQDQIKPTMKYYAFDWDDNLMYMPTKIYLKDEDGNSVGMSTEDFAEYRTEVGKDPFEYEGHTIVGFDDVSEDQGLKLVIDGRSMLYLLGTELDFTEGLNGKGFQFTNPNASRTCGCGESFGI